MNKILFYVFVSIFSPIIIIGFLFKIVKIAFLVGMDYGKDFINYTNRN
jgi:hypothetical protein